MKTARILTSILFLTFVSTQPARAQQPFAGLAEPVFFGAGAQPVDVKAIDLDGDGLLDLVVANSGFPGDPTPPPLPSIMTLRQTAPMNFVIHQTIIDPRIIEPVVLSLGDLNNDGLTDVVAADGSGHDILSFVGQPGGMLNFIGSFMVDPSLYITSVDLGQLDPDGVLDAVATFPDQLIGRLFGLGDGGFGPAAFFPSGASPTTMYFVALADVGADSALDAVTVSAQKAEFGEVNIAYGDGNGDFGGANGAVSFEHALDNPRHVVVADVDGDGNLDIVAPAFGAGNITHPDGYGVLIMFGDVNGTYTNTVFINPGPANNPDLQCVYAVAVGDMNNDTFNDIVVTHFNGNCLPGNSDADLTVLLNTGARTFAVAQTLTFPPINNHPNPTATSPKLFDLVDLDNDGDLDVVTTRLYDIAGNPPQGNGFIAIFENLTNPNADLNGDGRGRRSGPRATPGQLGPLQSTSTIRLRWRHQS